MTTAPDTEHSAMTNVADEVRAWLGRFIAPVHVEDLDVMTLWALHTHRLDACHWSPRLLVTSEGEGSGKSMAVSHLRWLGPEGATSRVEMMSAATLSRAIGAGARVVCLDEVDKFLVPGKPDYESFAAVINSGWSKDGVRAVTDDGQFRELPLFCALAMAGIQAKVPGDTLSRCHVIPFLPAASRVEMTDPEKGHAAQARALGRRIAAWSAAAGRGSDDPPFLTEALAQFPALVNDVARIRQRWLALARVAEVVGGRWPETCRALVERDCGRVEDRRSFVALTDGQQALIDVATVWPEARDVMASKELVDLLRPTFPGRYQVKRDLTPKMLATFVTGFGVEPARFRDAEGRQARGYRRTGIVGTAEPPSGLGAIPADGLEAAVKENPGRTMTLVREALAARTGPCDTYNREESDL